jgi:putative transposase
MARKLRMQYPDALYHVVNRGNHRRDIFATAGAAQTFVTTLEEATAAFGWQVHAYAVTRNHYHVVLRTLQPNLVEGMHWLQSTLATRLNRFRQARGHLFQGRYHAGLIEDGRTLAQIVDYVHLKPVQERLVAPEQVSQFRWSSLRRFLSGTAFDGLVSADWCVNRDRGTGVWLEYVAHLVALAVNLDEQKRLGWDLFSHSWALGSAAWQTALSRDQRAQALAPGPAAKQRRELLQARWQEIAVQALAHAGKTEEDLRAARKTAAWKISLAAQLQREHGIAITWLATRLHLGSANTVRSLLSRQRDVRRLGQLSNHNRPDSISLAN